MLEHALARTRAELARDGLAAAILSDPVNIRYLTGTSFLPVWELHATDRFLIVPVESPPVLWEYRGSPPETPVSALPDLVVRSAPVWSVFGRGEHAPDDARAAAEEIAASLPRSERIGVDRLDALLFLALQASGLELADAQLPLERARAVKSPEEIEALRRSARICDAAVAHLYETLSAGADRERAVGRVSRPRLRRRRRVRGDAAPQLGAAHEPVVPRGVVTRRRGRRARRVRHRPDRPARISRRRVTDVSRAGPRGTERAAAPLRGRSRLRRARRSPPSGRAPRSTSSASASRAGSRASSTRSATRSSPTEPG